MPPTYAPATALSYSTSFTPKELLPILNWVPVDINIDNAVSALGAVWLTGTLSDELARSAMKSYPGVERRFEFHLKEEGRAIIDDYAHHPDELSRSIASVRALYPGKTLTVAFQPHLYSRTRDFADEFAQALSAADEVMLVDLYPAREKPIPGISSKTIFDKVKCEKIVDFKRRFCQYNEKS